MADLADSTKLADNEGISWLELASLFTSCGITRSDFISYSIPYINAVAPQMIQMQSARISPFMGLIGGSSDNKAKTAKTYGKDGKLTTQDVTEFFS